RIRMADGRFREPDVAFLSTANRKHRVGMYWESADLVTEVISEGDPDRDWIVKRELYAEAGIAEYWIVDPRDRRI
ncbi:MAG: Uma2 family endonuclease, partial [Planctomycetota bacterium]